jgi:leader peptidase (prepilin peptidase) / N-methyltransferase
MLEIVAFLCLAGALILLVALSAVDLREGLLPNELVLSFLGLGIIFHLTTLFAFLSTTEMITGCVMGFAVLYIIRYAAHKFYAQDALGLGDVKLLAAAGVWLGPYYILLAMTMGALAGIVHGLSVAVMQWQKTGSFPAFSTLALPAGPGFAVGIALAGIYTFRNFPEVFTAGFAP